MAFLLFRNHHIKNRNTVFLHIRNIFGCFFIEFLRIFLNQNLCTCGLATAQAKNLLTISVIVHILSIYTIIGGGRHKYQYIPAK